MTYLLLFMMKHTYHGSILDKKEDIDIKNKQVLEANMFACEVLAPSCVLEYLKKDTAEDIKNITRLSYDDSLKYITELHRAKDDYDDYIKNKIVTYSPTYASAKRRGSMSRYISAIKKTN